jgi:hypothetical protein
VGPNVASKLEGQLKVGPKLVFQWGNKFWIRFEKTAELGSNFGTHFERQNSLEATLGPTQNFNRMWETVWEALSE